MSKQQIPITVDCTLRHKIYDDCTATVLEQRPNGWWIEEWDGSKWLLLDPQWTQFWEVVG